MTDLITERDPIIGYWNNCTPLQPHTLAMRDRANNLWAQAMCMADANEVAQMQVYPWADIEFLQCCAADLERFSLMPARLFHPEFENAWHIDREAMKEASNEWVDHFIEKLPVMK